MDQRRDRRVDELREETGLQVSLHVQQQLTMTLRLLDEMQQHLGIASGEELKSCTPCGNY